MRCAARDDAVAEELFFVEPERVGSVNHEAVELDEGALVDECLDTLARGAFTALVLLCDGVGAGRHRGLLCVFARSSSYFSARLFTRMTLHASRGIVILESAAPGGHAKERPWNTASHVTSRFRCFSRRCRCFAALPGPQRRARGAGFPDAAARSAGAAGS